MKEVARTQKRGWLVYSGNYPFSFLNSIVFSRFLFDLIFRRDLGSHTIDGYTVKSVQGSFG